VCSSDLAIRKWEIQTTLLYSGDTLKLEVLDQVLWDLDLLPMSVRNNLVTGVGAAAGTSGGSLADGAYYYVVTAVDPYGENKKSAEVCGVIVGGGGNGKVTVTWSALAGASKYRVYGRTTGAENLYFETTNLSYVDTGAAGTAGTPPAVASAFFVTNVVDEGIAGGCKLAMKFMLCPTIFFLAEAGYGYGYGEDYGIQL